MLGLHQFDFGKLFKTGWILFLLAKIILI